MLGGIVVIINKCCKEHFVVIGKEGSTNDGDGFIQRLWEDANSHFQNGNLVGIWGAMSDMSRSFQPWENGFTKGLYLAGVECVETVETPTGWTRWDVPGYEYIYVENESEEVFTKVIQYLQENKMNLVGAVHDFTCPETGKSYMFFPIKKIQSFRVNEI